MSEFTPRAHVDAIIARDGLRLAPEEYERLVALYDETQTQLATLRAAEFGHTEPAVIYHPR